MDFSSHFPTRLDSSSIEGFTAEPGPMEGSPSSAVKQVVVLDCTKPDLGLAPDLVQALAKDNEALRKASLPPKAIAGILVKWLEYFYTESVSISKHPSLFAIEGQVIHFIGCPGVVEDREEPDWFFTNVIFIQEYLCKDSKLRHSLSRKVQIINWIFKHVRTERIKEGLKLHLNELLKPVFKASEKHLRKEDILKLLTDLAELSATVYQDRNYIFKEFQALFSEFSPFLVQDFSKYLSNKENYPDLPLGAFRFLLQRVYCTQDPALAKLLPDILTKMEEQQEYFADPSLAVAYAQVYGNFLKLYFAWDSTCTDLYSESTQKRLLYLVFLSSQFPGSDSAFTLKDIAQILDFEAVKSLSTPQEQGTACARFVNQLYSFCCPIRNDAVAVKENKMNAVFEAYFKKKHKGSCDYFSVLTELAIQLDGYIQDLAKDKGPTELLQHVLTFIKSFATLVSPCPDSITNLIKSPIPAFAKDALAEGLTKAKLLADLIRFLSNYIDKLNVSHPLAWLVELMSVQQLWSIASTYLEQQPEGYEAHEHSIYLDLLKYIYRSLDREASVALVKGLEDKKDFFENSVCSQDYQALYQDILISYFFHKMTHSQVYFCDYAKDKERLQKVAMPLYTAFIKEVIAKEKLIYADNPLNGDDLEVATPPLLKDLNCKVVTNNEGYFDVDQNFIDQLSLKPSLGNVLKLSATDETPIGYTAYIPEDTKAVLVKVYGGTEKKDKKNAAKYSLPNRLDQSLLQQKVAIILLNLPDLLELSVHQSNMPSELYAKIQACIHRFHTVLSTDPESLHKDLGSLHGLPVGLYGPSFGGSLTFNQSLLYPKSFTRYISHSGALDASQQFDKDVTASQEGTITERFPLVKRAKDLQDTYLALHTANDPCVSVQCSLGFYKKAAAEGKRVKLSISPKGGRAVIEDSSKFAYTGHGAPILNRSFEFYTQEIVNFLTQAKPLTPLTQAISAWRAHAYENYMAKSIYGRKNDKKEDLGSLEQSIVSQMYLLYKNACVFRGKEKDLAEPSKILDANQTDTIWNQYYFPQYKAYKAAEWLLDNGSQLNAFLERGDLDTLFLKASERFLANHWVHFEEILNMKLDRAVVDLSSIAKDLAGELRQPLTALNTMYNWRAYPFSTNYIEFLATLLIEHPQLIKDNIPEHILEGITKESPQLKETFLKLIRESKRLGARTITQGVLSLHTEGHLQRIVQDYRAEAGKALDVRAVV